MEFNKGKEKAKKESEYLSDWEDKETWKWGFEDGYKQAIEDSKAPEMFEMLKGLVSDVENLLSEHNIEWQQSGYLTSSKQLLTKITQ